MSDLRRSIGPVRATAMVVGTIIGASIFVQPSVITGEMRSVAGVVLVWAFAGALTLAGALICAELASAYPLSGGVYVFLREAYSPSLGFLWGWAMFWSMHSGIIAAIAMVFSRYVAYFVPLGDTGLRAVAIGAILLLSAINYVGVAFGGAVQPRFGTPHRAIALQAVWSSVLVALWSYRALFTQVVFTEWIFFAALAVGLVRLRTRPGYAPAYRLWGVPAVPLLFAAASQIAANPRTSLFGLALVLAGLPVYFGWSRGHSPHPTPHLPS